MVERGGRRPRTATASWRRRSTLLADGCREPPADDRDRDRAWRMLVRKGYEPELAYDAVRAHERATPPERRFASASPSRVTLVDGPWPP